MTDPEKFLYISQSIHLYINQLKRELKYAVCICSVLRTDITTSQLNTFFCISFVFYKGGRRYSGYFLSSCDL